MKLLRVFFLSSVMFFLLFSYYDIIFSTLIKQCRRLWYVSKVQSRQLPTTSSLFSPISFLFPFRFSNVALLFILIFRTSPVLLARKNCGLPFCGTREIPPGVSVSPPQDVLVHQRHVNGLLPTLACLQIVLGCLHISRQPFYPSPCWTSVCLYFHGAS